MSMIKFKEWLNKRRVNEMGEAPAPQSGGHGYGTAPTAPAMTDPAYQMQQLQRQMMDPRITPQAKQQLQAQIQQLQGQQGQQRPPQAPQQPQQPQQPQYQWSNGRPVPANMNRA